MTIDKVYQKGEPFGVIAGIADFHTSILALEKLNVITDPNANATTNTFQETSINMMIIGTTRSILTDPTFVTNVPPQHCKGSDCKSLFLPGGLELVRQLNGTALNFQVESPEDSVIIVNDAPGYQVEYAPSNYSFNHATDCTTTGFDVSSFYSCLVFTGDAIISGKSIDFNFLTS